jgi:hypothetical protein
MRTIPESKRGNKKVRGTLLCEDALELMLHSEQHTSAHFCGKQLNGHSAEWFIATQVSHKSHQAPMPLALPPAQTKVSGVKWWEELVSQLGAVEKRQTGQGTSSLHVGVLGVRRHSREMRWYKQPL